MSVDTAKKFKSWHAVVLLAVLFVGMGLKLYSYHLNAAQVKIGNRIYDVLVAKTMSQQYRGWSRYRDMGGVEGKLFVFNARSQHAMVMRDMIFPLDMIWLDGETVVDMAPGVPIEPGKSEADLTPYFARAPSTMVLEMASGTIADSGLKIGDNVGIAW
ncbi:MAG: DUF192 domain-containing protein [Candidatus Magasanikbacteria bacterium]|jgi:hypothetical protein